MKEIISVIVDNRVVLPAEVRQHLGVSDHDRVVFVLADDRAVALRPVEPAIEHVFGSVPALAGRETGDFDDLIEEAMADRADEIVRRMGGD